MVREIAWCWWSYFAPEIPCLPCSQFTSLSLKQNSFISIRQTIWLENTVIHTQTQKLMASTRDRLPQDIKIRKHFIFVIIPRNSLGLSRDHHKFCGTFGLWRKETVGHSDLFISGKYCEIWDLWENMRPTFKKVAKKIPLDRMHLDPRQLPLSSLFLQAVVARHYHPIIT